MGQIADRQSASVQRTRSTLAGLSEVPRGTNTHTHTHTHTPMNANRAISIAAQRTQGL